MTQEDLAARTGLARSTIANLETRVKNPQFGTVTRIARATGVSLDAIAEHEPTALDLAAVRTELLAELRAVRELLDAILAATTEIRDDLAAHRAGADEAGPQPAAD